MTDKKHINDSLKNSDKNFNENFTQEKEQIIIDGVDILDCDDYYVEQETDQVKCDLSGDYCRENKDCLFKQLARKTQECEKLSILAQEESAKNGYIEYELNDKLKQKTQECEELKERNALLESQMAFNLSEMGIRLGNEINRSETLLKELKRFDKIKDEFREMSEKLKIENIRYRKALEEIEKVINNILNSCLGRNTVGCRPAHNVCGDLIKILDIINKAKGERK